VLLLVVHVVNIKRFLACVIAIRPIAWKETWCGPWGKNWTNTSAVITIPMGQSKSSYLMTCAYSRPHGASRFSDCSVLQWTIGGSKMKPAAPGSRQSSSHVLG